MNHKHEKLLGTVAQEPLGFCNFLALALVQCATADGPSGSFLNLLPVQVWMVQLLQEASCGVHRG